MVQLKLKTSRPSTQKKSPSNNIASACRRCGPECSCNEEEIDAGGPA